MEIKIVKHSEEKEQLADLFRICFGRNIPERYWEWKYVRNPAAPKDTTVVVAMDGGRIVGARPFQFTEMWLGNERITAAQHTDTMVHPEYRRGGVFSRMTEYAIQGLRDEKCELSYGFPGPESRGGFLKQGWKAVVDTMPLFQVVRPDNLLAYKLRNRSLSTALGFLYRMLPADQTKPTLNEPELFGGEVFNCFPDVLTGVDSLRDERTIDIVRSERYLRWRFDEHPEFTYTYVAAKKDGKLCGYAVVSVQQETNGLIYGIIVDYAVRDDDTDCFQALIHRCLHELGKSDYDIILVWSFSPQKFESELLSRFGFKSASKFPYNRFFSYNYMDVLHLDGNVTHSIDINNYKNWKITYAFTDTR